MAHKMRDLYYLPHFCCVALHISTPKLQPTGYRIICAFITINLQMHMHGLTWPTGDRLISITYIMGSRNLET